jgi:hypothetical protein
MHASSAQLTSVSPNFAGRMFERCDDPPLLAIAMGR